MTEETIPEPFSFQGDNVTNNWNLWKEKFNLYLITTGNHLKDDTFKINLLLNSLGDEGLQIFNSFPNENSNKENYSKVIEKFDQHCNLLKICLHERHTFFQRDQQVNESVSEYIAALKQLALKCEFKDEDILILNRIVLGVCDSKIQEKLLECSDLDLNKALYICRSIENTALAQSDNTNKANAAMDGEDGREAIEKVEDFHVNDKIQKNGRAKEVELVKSEDALGLTITDNGAGYCFIKRIKDGSVISNIPHIEVGDHIEKLNGIYMVGKRHFEVAKALKDIPVGTSFVIRLIEPMRSGFTNIAPKSSKTGKKNYGSGKETLRFKAGGKAEIEEQDDALEAGIDKINVILESFMGINDSELARQIWDMSVGKQNSMDFAEAIDDSDLAAFEFTDELIIELWGAVTDARDGRYKS